MTELKKTFGLALITPSAMPVILLKVLSRPLTKRKNWEGPTAPMVSGGNAPFSVGPVTALKLRPIVCGAEEAGKSAAAIIALPLGCSAPTSEDGMLATGFASGF